LTQVDAKLIGSVNKIGRFTVILFVVEFEEYIGKIMSEADGFV